MVSMVATVALAARAGKVILEVGMAYGVVAMEEMEVAEA